MKKNLLKVNKKKTILPVIAIFISGIILGAVALTLFAPPLNQTLILQSDDEQIILTAKTAWNAYGWKDSPTFTNITMDIINPSIDQFICRIWIEHETENLSVGDIYGTFNWYANGESTPCKTFSDTWAVSNGKLFTAHTFEPVVYDFYYCEMTITFLAPAVLGEYTLIYEVFTNS